MLVRYLTLFLHVGEISVFYLLTCRLDYVDQISDTVSTC